MTLRVGENFRDGVYRRIHAWQPIPSGHGPGIHYLLLHARVEWRTPPREADIFTIVMQYSPTPGSGVALKQPAHILDSDASVVLPAFSDFVSRATSGA